jgi:hypothetical protein
MLGLKINSICFTVILGLTLLIIVLNEGHRFWGFLVLIVVLFKGNSDPWLHLFIYDVFLLPNLFKFPCRWYLNDNAILKWIVK